MSGIKRVNNARRQAQAHGYESAGDSGGWTVALRSQGTSVPPWHTCLYTQKIPLRSEPSPSSRFISKAYCWENAACSWLHEASLSFSKRMMGPLGYAGAPNSTD
ncbi:uncharacterized protein ARMOST_05676 [Armillaria ostoyae]|uniref:Uncharacterized protein n=1 Tax=Armillaria ostoyae TaxID=47428 RepID=A0A284R0U7_ARMOS|nr:uncharacterized protein ARMOST_05676 [Armillaria ostoyae]